MNLSMLRKQVGVTQKAVAEALGVSQSTVSRGETGRNFPRGYMLPAFAEEFHCTVDDWLTNDTEQDQMAKGA